MTSLEQYYTEDQVGERLTSMLPDFAPKTCLELSAGEGALIGQVLKKWPNLAVTTCELDSNNVLKLCQRFNGHHVNINALSPQFETHFGMLIENFDLSISNPPYNWIILDDYIKKILASFSILNFFKGNKIRSEIVFILQYLRLTKNNGVLAFILPELLIAGTTFAKFREFLFKVCTPLSLAEIKSGSFKGTEARTYILSLAKTPSPIDHKISYIAANGISSTLTLTDLTNGFRDIFPKLDPSTKFTNIEISRGTLTGKECKTLNFPFYHTSGFNFNKNQGITRIKPLKHAGSKVVYAEKNNVLIARVGSRVLGNAVFVEDGIYAVSDCVFVIRILDRAMAKDFIDYWRIFFSENSGTIAKGTCAKYITKDVVYFALQHFLKQNFNRNKLIQNS
ncbi:Eco57I restriction-modification methylase domain-containing protein [Rheinheimera oceanensis]|uniref:Eco57I restriction-modification methylase domain-containing protein n=1 Tax=Rheinheimera oceanensis TaxID=2817449 RepID=UPI001BFED47D|nr:N-6 DNA methylase [Rheinheimera oceanensis]